MDAQPTPILADVRMKQEVANARLGDKRLDNRYRRPGLQTIGHGWMHLLDVEQGFRLALGGDQEM